MSNQITCTAAHRKLHCLYSVGSHEIILYRCSNCGAFKIFSEKPGIYHIPRGHHGHATLQLAEASIIEQLKLVMPRKVEFLALQLKEEQDALQKLAGCATLESFVVPVGK